MVVLVQPDKKSIITMDNGSRIQSVVYTDPKFAKKIIDYFTPQFKDDDNFLDPCMGKGAFYNHLPDPKDWCEIQDGKDFLNYDKHTSWIFANPPWAGTKKDTVTATYGDFAQHCYEVGDNVVFLHKLFGVLGTQRRLRDIKNNNFGIKEIILCDWKDAAFTYLDGSAKLGEGFLLSVVHLQRGYNDGTHWNYSWTKMKNETDVKQWNKDSQYVKSKNGKLSTRTKYQ